jgi:hypothetical protein
VERANSANAIFEREEEKSKPVIQKVCQSTLITENYLLNWDQTQVSFRRLAKQSNRSCGSKTQIISEANVKFN